MESNKNTSSYYLTVNGEKVMVSREVYQMIREENNHIRYNARIENRCAQENYRYCLGDCMTCSWHTEGSFKSDEDIGTERLIKMAADVDVEAEAISSITMERVYAAADQLVQDGALIFRMRFEENCSNREIGKRLGLAHQVIDRKMLVLLDYFRKRQKLFF